MNPLAPVTRTVDSSGITRFLLRRPVRRVIWSQGARVRLVFWEGAFRRRSWRADVRSPERRTVEIERYARGTIGPILHASPRMRGAVAVRAGRRRGGRDDAHASVAPMLP